jgi:hydroxypyruvate reductase
LNDTLAGEEIGNTLSQIGSGTMQSGHIGRLVISGGETTVTLRGSGLGGRNQEFVLAAAMDLRSMENIVILSAGTDGTDGPTDAAGAIADGETMARASQIGMKALAYLQNNDSYHFFERLDDLIKTGPTKTNVMDIRIMLIGG